MSTKALEVKKIEEENKLLPLSIEASPYTNLYVCIGVKILMRGLDGPGKRLIIDACICIIINPTIGE